MSSHQGDHLLSTRNSSIKIDASWCDTSTQCHMHCTCILVGWCTDIVPVFVETVFERTDGMVHTQRTTGDRSNSLTQLILPDIESDAWFMQFHAATARSQQPRSLQDE